MRKRAVSLALCLCMVLSLLPPPVLATGKHPFTDVAETEWFNDSVAYVYERNLMKGTSDTTFEPYKATQRGMIVTILHRLEGTPTVPPENPFADVPQGSNYEKAIIWAANNGIVNGYDNATFAPYENITRQQMAAILYRYAQMKGYRISTSANLSEYADSTQIGDYARTAMAWANGEGLINGNNSKQLMPTGTATRAQAAAILTRFCQNVLPQQTPPISPPIEEPPQTTPTPVDPINYTVTFDLNYDEGGIYQTLSVIEGEKIVPPIKPTRDKYHFLGWYTSPTGGTQFNFNKAIDAITTLYARWSRQSSGNGSGYTSSTPDHTAPVSITHLVSFDSNEGTYVSAQAVANGAKAVYPPNPTKDGFTFIGWYGDSDLLFSYNFDTVVTQDITLYAGWQPTYCTVSFFTSEENVNNMPPNQVIQFGELAVKPTNPDREDYEFLYWHDQNGSIFDFSNPIDEDIQLNAVWVSEDLSFDDIDTPLMRELSNAVNDSLKTGASQLTLQDDAVTSVSVDYSLSQAATPLIKPVNSGSLTGQTAGIIGNFVDITVPENVAVNSAKITFHYDPDKIDADPKNLGVVWYDESHERMVLLEDVTNDTSENSISVITRHFSLYGVVDTNDWNEAWSKQQYAVRTAETPYYSLVLALDCSGSMDGYPMQLSIVAAQNLIDKLSEQDRVAVLKFNNSASTVVPRTRISGIGEAGVSIDNRPHIKNLIASIKADGGTNINAALNEAKRLAIDTIGDDNSYDESKYQTLILLLSDGQSEVSQSIIEGLSENNLRVITVGFGSGVRQSLMEQIANGTGGKYMYCDNATGIANIFEDIQNEYIGSTTDTDGDGLPDIVETQGMRNQVGQIIYTNPQNADTDGDGISDGEEMGKYDDSQQPVIFRMTSDPTVRTEKQTVALIDDEVAVLCEPSMKEASTCTITVGVIAILKKTVTTFSVGGGSTKKEIIYSAPDNISIEINQETLPKGIGKKWKIKAEHEISSVVYPDNILYYKSFDIQYNTKTNPVNIEFAINALNIESPFTKTQAIDPNAIVQEYNDNIVKQIAPYLNSASSTITRTRENAYKQTQDIAKKISDVSNFKMVDDYRQSVMDSLSGLSTSPSMDDAIKCAVADAILTRRAHISISELKGIADEGDIWQNFSFVQNILERILAYTFKTSERIEVSGQQYTVYMDFTGVANNDGSGVFTCFISTTPGNVSGIVTLNSEETEKAVQTFTKELDKLKADEIKKMRRAALDMVAKSLLDLPEGDGDEICATYLKQVCGGFFSKGFKNVIKNVISDGENLIKLAEGVKNQFDHLDDLTDLYNDLKDVSDGKKAVAPSKLLNLIGDMDKLIKLLS